MAQHNDVVELDELQRMLDSCSTVEREALATALARGQSSDHPDRLRDMLAAFRARPRTSGGTGLMQQSQFLTVAPKVIIGNLHNGDTITTLPFTVTGTTTPTSSPDCVTAMAYEINDGLPVGFNPMLGSHPPCPYTTWKFDLNSGALPTNGQYTLTVYGYAGPLDDHPSVTFTLALSGMMPQAMAAPLLNTTGRLQPLASLCTCKVGKRVHIRLASLGQTPPTNYVVLRDFVWTLFQPPFFDDANFNVHGLVKDLPDPCVFTPQVPGIHEIVLIERDDSGNFARYTLLIEALA